MTGGSGLLRTEHAETNAPGQFRIGFVGEWFSAGFLCTHDYPCPNPKGGNLLTSDTLSHTGGTLTLGVSMVKLGAGALEASASLISYANSDVANRTPLLQVLGDTSLGVKYVAPVGGDVLHLGAFWELWLINASGSVGLDGSGTSTRIGGVATLDLRGLSAPAPLRFSANVDYFVDNTGDVLSDTESARGQPVTRIERYGLGVNRVDHVDFLLGGEALLVDQRVRPFIEGRVLAAYNRQGYVCSPDNPGHDRCLKNDTVVPATLTIGGRFFPWKPGLSLLAAIDIGLSGMNNFIEELQPVPPWTLYLGAGWGFDTWDRPAPKAPPVVVERSTSPRLVHVVGFVHEKEKNDPVVGAIVAYTDHTDLSRLATGPDGRFSDDVPPGVYNYQITAEGYRPGVCTATATASPAAKPPSASLPAQQSATAPAQPTASTPAQSSSERVDIDCALEALPRLGTVTGRLRDADNGQPLPNVTITMTDAQRRDLLAPTDTAGGFRFEGVSPGTVTLSAVADGYLALVTPIDVKARQETTLDLLLRPKPAKPEARLMAKEITIRDQIQFALDSSVILPQSFGILTEVADLLIRHPEIQRLEVQGHTDNSGTGEHNQTLSQDRAEAVRGWLVQHGVYADRLVSKGYGQSKPLAPNTTAANRAQNRRVQFIILEKAGAAPPPAGEKPADGKDTGKDKEGGRVKHPLPGF